MLQNGDSVCYGSKTTCCKTTKDSSDLILRQLEGYRKQFIHLHTKWFPACTSSQLNDAYSEGVILFYSNMKSGNLQVLQTSIKNYVFAVAKKVLLNESKKSTKLIPLSIDISLEDIAEKLRKEECDVKKCLVYQAIQALGPRAQQMLTLLLIQGKTIREVTKIMNFSNVCSASTAKHKSILKLKRLVAKKLEEWEKDARET